MQGAIFNNGQMQSNKKKVAKGTAKKIKNCGKEQLEWYATDPTVPNFDFSQNVGLKVDVPDGTDPIFFMNLLLTDDIVAEIKDNSNYYAERVIESTRPLRRWSVLNKWTPITDDEISLLDWSYTWALLTCLLINTIGEKTHSFGIHFFHQS